MATTTKTEKAQFGLCCNNPDNGMFQGWADFAHIDWPDGTVSRMSFSGTKVDYLFPTLQVGRVKANCSNYRDWVGNWCWNEYIINCDDAIKIMEYLAARRKLDFEEWSLEGMGWIAYLAVEKINNAK